MDRDELLSRIDGVGDLGALEALRVETLGKSGSVTALLKSLGGMDAETRASEGPKIHALREAVTDVEREWETALGPTRFAELRGLLAELAERA